jgi:hypothetical protein
MGRNITKNIFLSVVILLNFNSSVTVSSLRKSVKRFFKKIRKNKGELNWI